MSIRTEPAPAIAGVATVGVAAIAWAVVVRQGSMAMSSGMGMGLSVGALGVFAVAWVGMMAAMMLPPTAPLAATFVRRLGPSRLWPVGVVSLIAGYLVVWTVFGVLLYVTWTVVMPSWQLEVTLGVAIAFAGLYALTPMQRGGQARCLQMCRESTRLDGNPILAGLWQGFAYGLRCIACSAGVMVAVLVAGMSDLRLMVLAAALVLVSKLDYGWLRRAELMVAVALIVVGIGLTLHARPLLA